MPTIHNGDCIEVMNQMPAESVDAIVTDPPYGLGFMGRKWDALPPSQEWAEACYRVLKPGGHIAAFGGTRTWHRLAVAIEDAGFEMRDSLAWLYGSGFPKSHDVGKAIDKLAGAEREVTGEHPTPAGSLGNGVNMEGGASREVVPLTAPATPEAVQWDGWGTALKPGHEPVVVARKPHVISGILDGIGSELARLEDECRPSANGAAKSSAPTPADSQEVRTDTAPASAATPHEGEQARTTPTGEAAGSSAATDTSAFESEGETCWNTVTSWRACWDELCDLTSTSITSTASSLTTDLRTLWSSISSLTATSTPGSPTSALTSPSTASAVDSLFAATVLRLRATLALSAPESATASTPHVPQGAGGSSAFEPIVLARKPLAEKTVARNVLAHGTGAINVDACRIGLKDDETAEALQARSGGVRGFADQYVGGKSRGAPPTDMSRGRWPANVLLDHHAAAWVDEQSGHQKDGVAVNRNKNPDIERPHTVYGGGWMNGDRPDITYGGGGGASRFFYTIREDITCQIPDPASTAGSLSSPPSASAGFAAGHAATSASPGIVSEARSASTNDTGTGSRRSGASGTPPIGTTGSECSPESRHARPTPTPSHASNVELSEPTDITTTTTSPSISGGSAESATSSTTPASDLGVLPGGESGSRFMYSAKAPKRERPNVDGVQHPTVKPLAIMRWLIRLVTPPGGVVLDPFAGSGTTIEAALIEGFDPVGIEMETGYLPLIQHRIDRQAATLTA